MSQTSSLKHLPGHILISLEPTWASAQLDHSVVTVPVQQSMTVQQAKFVSVQQSLTVQQANDCRSTRSIKFKTDN